MAAEIVQPSLDVEHDLAELRRPAGRLVVARHEAGVMVDRLEQRHLEAVADVEHAERAVAEPARAVGRSHA